MLLRRSHRWNRSVGIGVATQPDIALIEDISASSSFLKQ
jgi:hypothetical protein